MNVREHKRRDTAAKEKPSESFNKCQKQHNKKVLDFKFKVRKGIFKWKRLFPISGYQFTSYINRAVVTCSVETGHILH